MSKFLLVYAELPVTEISWLLATCTSCSFFGLLCSCAIHVFLRKYQFSETPFPPGHIFLRICEFIEFHRQQNSWSSFYYSSLPSWRRGTLIQRSQLPFLSTFSTSSSLLLAFKWNVISLLAVFRINISPTPSKSLLDNLFCIWFFLPNICADGEVSIISKSGALADSASCSQTALPAWCALLSIPVTPPLCIPSCIIIHMLILW